MQGYHGVNCSIQCPFPTYGIRCQKYCTCSKDLCDVSTGCYTLVDSILIFPYFALETLNYFILNCIIYLFTARIIPPPKKKSQKVPFLFQNRLNCWFFLRKHNYINGYQWTKHTERKHKRFDYEENYINILDKYEIIDRKLKYSGLNKTLL